MNEKMEMMEMRASDLGRSFRCSEMRNKNILLSGEGNNNFRKAIFIKNEIRQLLRLRKTDDVLTEDVKKDLVVRLREFFGGLDYQTSKTAKIHADDAYRQIMRYVLSETRKPCFPAPKTVELGGMNVKVSPDMVFTYGDVIEVVKLKCSKPQLASNSKKQDGGANNSLELYAMFEYGKTFVKVGHTATVKASIYYLRKSTDKSDGTFDLDFFNGGGNVVSIADTVSGGRGLCLFGCKKGCEECEFCDYPQMCEYVSEYGNLDMQFLPQIEDFKKGVNKHECTKEMCDSCDFKNVCAFNKPPEVLEKKPVKKSVRDLDLTKAQEDAIYFRKGLCRINAGAGAGKTLVVALRVATMISEGVNPEEILLLTFTNTGAEEMRERVALYNEDFGNTCDMSKLRATTFNAFGDELIKEKWQELGYTEEPRLIDEVERAKLIISLLNETDIPGLDYRNFDMATMSCKGALTVATKCFDIIKAHELAVGDGSQLKDLLESDHRFVSSNDAFDAMIELFYRYDNILRDRNLYEYEDQNKMVFEYIHRNPYYLDDLGIKCIIVDEFQDSNLGQLNLIKEMRNTKSFESLMVVGDDSQAIFSFRDTTLEYIIRFFDYMGEKGEDIFLMENHRSTPQIISLANSLNDLNKVKVAKSLIATRPDGKDVVARGFSDKDEEYKYIVDGIRQHIEEGTAPNDIAFIGKNKSELLKLGTMLTNAGIEWVMLSPELYLENARVIAAIELMKAIENPKATKCMLPYLNCLKDGMLMDMDNKEIKNMLLSLQDKLFALRSISEKKKLELVTSWLQAIDLDDEVYQSFLQKLSYRKSLTEMIAYCKDFEKYGTRLAVRREKDYTGVVLTTAHSSKGLEWPVVYNSITNYFCEREDRNLKMREESRRLLFVSVTRARDELYITGQYKAFGTKKDRTYNRFLKECYDALGLEFAPEAELDVKAS